MTQSQAQSATTMTIRWFRWFWSSTYFTNPATKRQQQHLVPISPFNVYSTMTTTSATYPMRSGTSPLSQTSASSNTGSSPTRIPISHFCCQTFDLYHVHNCHATTILLVICYSYEVLDYFQQIFNLLFFHTTSATIAFSLQVSATFLETAPFMGEYWKCPEQSQLLVMVRHRWLRSHIYLFYFTVFMSPFHPYPHSFIY